MSNFTKAITFDSKLKELGEQYSLLDQETNQLKQEIEDILVLIHNKNKEVATLTKQQSYEKAKEAINELETISNEKQGKESTIESNNTKQLTILKKTDTIKQRRQNIQLLPQRDANHEQSILEDQPLYGYLKEHNKNDMIKLLESRGMTQEVFENLMEEMYEVLFGPEEEQSVDQPMKNTPPEDIKRHEENTHHTDKYEEDLSNLSDADNEAITNTYKHMKSLHYSNPTLLRYILSTLLNKELSQKRDIDLISLPIDIYKKYDLLFEKINNNKKKIQEKRNDIVRRSQKLELVRTEYNGNVHAHVNTRKTHLLKSYPLRERLYDRYKHEFSDQFTPGNAISFVSCNDELVAQFLAIPNHNFETTYAKGSTKIGYNRGNIPPSNYEHQRDGHEAKQPGDKGHFNIVGTGIEQGQYVLDRPEDYGPDAPNKI